MRLLSTLSLLFFAFAINAQNGPRPLKFTYFNLELGVAGLKSVGPATPNLTDNEHRFTAGIDLFGLIGHRFNDWIALETGFGFQFLPLEQRSQPFRFACDAPPTGPATYLDATAEYFALSVPFAARIYLSPAANGLYLRPRALLNFNILSEATADLHECGQDEEVMVNAGAVDMESFAVLLGAGLGYELNGRDGRSGYFELNFSRSLSNLITFPGNTGTQQYLDSAGALLIGLSVGWQIGG